MLRTKSLLAIKQTITVDDEKYPLADTASRARCWTQRRHAIELEHKLRRLVRRTTLPCGRERSEEEYSEVQEDEEDRMDTAEGSRSHSRLGSRRCARRRRGGDPE